MFLKDRRSAVFSLVAAVSAWLFIAPTDAIAQDSSNNPSFYDLSRQSTEIGWLPGEQYDPRTGHMNHVMTDLEFTGNGLPITIVRRIIQGNSHGIDIPFPELTVENREVNGGPSRCGIHADSAVFTDAFTEQTFENDWEINPNLTHFPSNARYMSKDNWIIKCAGNSYVVVSPDGISYTFGRSLGGSREKLHVSTISDVHGNKLTFGYKGYQPPVNTSTGYRSGVIDGVSSITADDGRQVTIEYAEVGHRSASDYMTSKQGDDYIKRISTNGAPNKRQVTYSLTRTGYIADHGLGKRYIYNFRYLNLLQAGSAFSTNMLEKVTYPTGGEVTYEYSPFPGFNLHTKNPSRSRHFPIESRSVKGPEIEEGTTTFQVRELSSTHNAYARIIDTPSSTIEYRYRQQYFGSNPDHDEGKLIGTKVFPGSLTNWSEYSTALIEKEFEYKVLNEFIPGNTRNYFRAAELVKEKTKLNFLNANSLVLPTNTLEYRIEYDYDNNGSNPEFRLRAKREFSPTGASRRTDYTYKTIATNTHWFTGLIESTANTTNDKSYYSYNADGLISTETHNGITTSYAYNGRNMASRTTAGATYKYQDYYRGIPRVERDESNRAKTRSVNSDGTVSAESDFGRSSKYYYELSLIHI